MFRPARSSVLSIAAASFATGFIVARFATATPVQATARPELVRSQEADLPAARGRPVAMAGARYPAQVLRVIDGDTVEARIGIWLGQEITTKIRLRGIDAPEIPGACPAESAQALAARSRLEQLVTGGGVTLQEIGPDKYHGRVVARLMMADGQDAGSTLVAEGHARPWAGRREGRWCALSPG